ncbi:hypothetical protein DCO58_08070 [Helicobacter saguini]|uniref:Phosphoribosylformylglycinamidine synthase subunit PurL n=2 Tax=Helicobacter saguini TaxID=1548018 RepID=A0A347VMT5_9HELI|nr:hypothetical protein [Helicobacter saguini]MWV67611.1 hypothetical protein [Helicobacter saguini]MWV69962.1 hypothetical protein [Helicobacter saguini]MWV72824.1 hypothetical protein [Helicobacter saguini]TLD92395.1 hypothetical protein LS64_010245 [Helicobacter saguini]
MGANPIANLNYLCFGDILDSKNNASKNNASKNNASFGVGKDSKSSKIYNSKNSKVSAGKNLESKQADSIKSSKNHNLQNSSIIESHKKVSKLKSLQKHLLKGVVSGISHYGNCMGIPTIGGQTIFNPCYNGNILVNAFSLGIVKHEQIFKGKASGVGNLIIYVGSKSGRDGLGGAVMSSDSFGDSKGVESKKDSKKSDVILNEAKNLDSKVIESKSQNSKNPNLDSKKVTENIESKHPKDLRPAVQIGDPFTEKLLLEACLQIFAENLIVGIQDMGAAGLTSSSFEMASRSKSGMILHLDKVPMREKGMNAYELMLSESQERMLICAKKGSENRIKEIFRFYNLECEVIGEVVDSNDMVLMWENSVISKLPIAPIVESAPILNRPVEKPAYLDSIKKLQIDIDINKLDSINNKFLLEILANLESKSLDVVIHKKQIKNSKKVTNFETPKKLEIQNALQNKEILNAIFKDILSSLNICDKEWIYSQYDSTIKSSTIKGGGMGDASIISLKNYASSKALSMSVKCDPKYCFLNPREGARIAVAMSGRNVALSGAKPLAISDCLNFGSPENPQVMWQFKESCEGIKEACEALKTPVISGNVSLYNQTGNNAIYPTPTIVNVGILEDYSNAIASHFVGNNTLICIVGKDIKSSFINVKNSKKDNFLQNLNLAGSTLQEILNNKLSGELQNLNLENELKLWDFLKECTQTKLLLSAKDIGQGGIAIALAKMAILGNKPISAFVDLKEILNTDYSKILNLYKRQIQNIITRIYQKFDEKEFEIFINESYRIFMQSGHIERSEISSTKQNKSPYSTLSNQSQTTKRKKNIESKKSSKIPNSKDSINSTFIDSIQSIFNTNLNKTKATDSITYNLLNSISNMQNNEKILINEIIRDFIIFSNIESISLFSQNHTQVVCEVFPHNLGIIKEIARQKSLECYCIGKVGLNLGDFSQSIKIGNINLSLKNANDLYFNSFESKIFK